ncbi:formyl transferase [Psychroflexus halocasei]|nr:formyl transferase [Psychroflexus halocasei]
MKIVLFLNKDMHANIAYQLLKPELLKHQVQIYYTDQVGHSSKRSEILQQIEYLEKERFFNEVASQDSCSNFEFLDDSFNSFPFKKAPKVNSKEFVDFMRKEQPDIFISIRFGQIFKDDIIAIPKHGLLNLHSGILPHYRGIMATLHALIDQNDKIGCTFHKITDSGIDTGEIISQSFLKTNSSKSLLWHITHIYRGGTDLIIQALRQIENSSFIKTHRQNINEGSYFSSPTSKDFLNLKESGFNLYSEKDYEDIIKTFVSS